MDSLRVPVRAVLYFRRNKRALRRDVRGRNSLRPLRSGGSAPPPLPPPARRQGVPRFGLGGGNLRPNVYAVSRPNLPALSRRSAQSRAVRSLAAATRARFTPIARPLPPARRDSGAFARAFAHLTPAALRSSAEARRVANSAPRSALADQRWEQHKRRQRAAEDAALLADLMDLARE